MRPAVTHALDQANAAGRDAAQAFATLRERPGMTDGEVDLAGPVGRVLARLAERALAGELSACEHLRRGEPRHWLAWRPSKLRCVACRTAAALATPGTPEDSRCDCCRKRARRGRSVHPQVVLVPAAVVDLGDGPPLTASPITAYFGLCPVCHAEASRVPAPRRTP